MSRALPPALPPALPLLVLATAVLVAGVGAAAWLPTSAQPAAAVAPAPSASAAAPAPAPVAVPAAAPPVREVRLAVRRAPAAPARRSTGYDPGDPRSWSTRQLAAQLVFSCVQSSDLGTAVAHARAGLGGIAVMGRPTDRAAFTAGLAGVKAAAPGGIAPLMASDEEGGRVQRLKGLLGPLPSAAVMGRWPDARIEQTAHDYGAGMRGLGVQLALSPVADLAAPGGYPAANGRAFSGDARRVAGASVAWSKGLQRAGVLSAVKHWPGHGYAADSHTAAPAVPALSVLEGRDLLPFDAVLRSGASIVMVGHLRSPGLTEPGLPATLSPNALRVLRQRSGPRTIVLTDSLSMAASSSAIGLLPQEAVVRALKAGADWAMSCVDPLPAVAAVQAALDEGRLARAAAESSARRILAVKHRLGLAPVPPTTAAPTGALDAAAVRADVVTLTGRAADPDTAEGRVRVLVHGESALEVTTPAGGGAFRTEVRAPRGAEVCVLALDTGGGPSTPLGCVTRRATSAPPA